MAPSFVFEPASDEELELESEQEDHEEEEEEEDEVVKEKASKRSNQSPWDFASYSESVAEEHARRSTTSIDFKISKVLQQHSLPITKPTDNDLSDSESDKQVTN